MAGAFWLNENSLQEEFFFWKFSYMYSESFDWKHLLNVNYDFSVLFKEHRKRMMTKNGLSTAQDNSSC